MNIDKFWAWKNNFGVKNVFMLKKMVEFCENDSNSEKKSVFTHRGSFSFVISLIKNSAITFIPLTANLLPCPFQNVLKPWRNYTFMLFFEFSPSIYNVAWCILLYTQMSYFIPKCPALYPNILPCIWIHLFLPFYH